MSIKTAAVTEYLQYSKRSMTYRDEEEKGVSRVPSKGLLLRHTKTKTSKKRLQ